MEKKIQILPSGISLVDESWGGFYRGGTYFLIGQHKSGKTLLGIQYVMECAKQKEVCLYFTTMRSKDLMFHAASINFDLQYYMDQNLIIVIRVTPPAAGQANEDEYLIEYFKDIAALVKQYYPNRIIFDELTPFIEFRNLKLLKSTFFQTIEIIEESNITSLFVLGEPATVQSENIVDILTSESTGTIYLDKEEDDLKIKGGKITIIPNVGHIEGRFSANYFLMPYKGITTERIDEKSESRKTHEESGYKKLSEIELPAVEYPSFNYYSFDELSLYINNQIALYKSTKQKFSVISFFLDPEAEKNNLLTINQVRNAVRLSIDKKDKFSVINNKIIILIVKEENENIKIISKVKNNLPLNDPESLNHVLKFISINSVVVDDSIKNSADIMKKLSVKITHANKETRFL